MIGNWPNGKLKLFCTAAALNLRRRHADLFLFGDYVPLTAKGERSDHVVALGRQFGRDAVIAIAPRLCARLNTQESLLPVGQSCWRDTAVELSPPFHDRRYRNLLTGESVWANDSIPLGTEFSILPVSLLVSQN